MSEQRDYGTPENPNLENITIELIHSVNEYQRLLPNVILDIEQVGKIDPMYLTPDKPNTARKVIPVRERIVSRGGSEMGDKIGDIYAILFRLGDGTGDQNTYKVDELDLPTNYFGFDNDNKVGLLPRKKDCIMEAFFPFFSIANNQIYRNLTSLTELTVDDIENPEVVVKTATLGTEYHAYGCKMRALKNSPPEKIEPKIQLTCGYSRNGERFGDPHSIVHNVSGLGWPDIMQVVGFLSIDEPNPYFARKIDQVASVPEDLWTKFK